MDYCNFCFNAYVQPVDLACDIYLDDTNDFHSATVGFSDKHIQLYINSGSGEALNLEVCELRDNRWYTVSKYYPKFCPECGRKLDEYIIETRGKSFKKKEV